jgi:hypothetical protein
MKHFQINGNKSISRLGVSASSFLACDQRNLAMMPLLPSHRTGGA